MNNCPSLLPGASTTPAAGGGSRELDVLSPSLQQMGLRQLGVLFKVRGRHIAELTQQISAQAEDNERHVGILRHEKVHYYCVRSACTCTCVNIHVHVHVVTCPVMPLSPYDLIFHTALARERERPVECPCW